MQKIVDISSEFYKLNDIEINNKKSELLILNSNHKNKGNNTCLEIVIGKSKEPVQAKQVKEVIRYLGV